jgi:hypothetical protein
MDQRAAFLTAHQRARRALIEQGTHSATASFGDPQCGTEIQRGDGLLARDRCAIRVYTSYRAAMFDHSDESVTIAGSVLHPSRSYSSKIVSATAYGGPWYQLGSGAASKIATTTRVPTSVQRHLPAAVKNSSPTMNSSCRIA